MRAIRHAGCLLCTCIYTLTVTHTHTHTCNHTHMFTQIVIMHRQKQVMRSWLCVVVVYWFDYCNNIPPLTRAIYYVLLIQLDPATVWLHEESPGNRAFFSDPQNTRFLPNDDVGILITDLVAMGSSVQTTSSATSVPLRMPSASSEPSTSGLPILQTQLSATRKAQSTNVKIVQASVKRLPTGKLEFFGQNQTFVDVTETTANLHYVT